MPEQHNAVNSVVGENRVMWERDAAHIERVAEHAKMIEQRERAKADLEACREILAAGWKVQSIRKETMMTSSRDYKSQAHAEDDDSDIDELSVQMSAIAAKAKA